TALEAVTGAGHRLVLVKRCFDLADLLAAAATGSAHVALVSHSLGGLDSDAVERLRAHGVRVVAVMSERPDGRRAEGDEIDEAARLLRTGIDRVVGADGVAGIAEELLAATKELATPGSGSVPVAPAFIPSQHDGGQGGAERQGRTVAVWGATGAPGRTTVAVGV